MEEAVIPELKRGGYRYHIVDLFNPANEDQTTNNIGKTPLITGDIISLVLFSIIIMNVVLYVYLGKSERQIPDLKTANKEMFAEIHDNEPFVSPFFNLITQRSQGQSASSPDFWFSLADAREKLMDRGIDASDILFEQAFKDHKGGIVWVKPKVRDRTKYQPTVPKK